MTVGAWKAWLEHASTEHAVTTASAAVSDDTPLFITQDSRALEAAKPGARAFVALPGNWHDGHAFLQEAHANGARYFLCDSCTTRPAGIRCRRCAGPVSRLAIAHPAVARRMRNVHHRHHGEQRQNHVKEWLPLMLRAPSRLAVRAATTAKSAFPSLAELTPHHEWGVVEAGINGEMPRSPTASASVGVSPSAALENRQLRRPARRKARAVQRLRLGRHAGLPRCRRATTPFTRHHRPHVGESEHDAARVEHTAR